MNNEIIKNNCVTIAGEVVSSLSFSHEVFGEGFYILEVLAKRLSGFCDIIPLMISERIIDVNKDYRGAYIHATGQFRSYNRHEENKNRLILSVFVRELEFVSEEVESAKDNYIFLDGYICKPSVYRTTPQGREIADMLLAINRSYGKTDYIPCISWGRNARFAERLKVGVRIQVKGRIQSREYQKKLSETEFETRTAYEVSVERIEVVESDIRRTAMEELKEIMGGANA